jgi:Universal stress protein family
MPDYQEDAFDVLAEAIAQMYVIDPDVEICPRVVKGQAGQVLVDAAEGADLLVVGGRGHGGLAGAVPGSVSRFCAHHAPCPVVIMRGKPALGQRVGVLADVDPSRGVGRCPWELAHGGVGSSQPDVRRGSGGRTATGPSRWAGRGRRQDDADDRRGVRGGGRVRHRPDRPAVPGPQSPRAQPGSPPTRLRLNACALVRRFRDLPGGSGFRGGSGALGYTKHSPKPKYSPIIVIGEEIGYQLNIRDK